MRAEQSGRIVYVTSPVGVDLDQGRIVLSLREARQLRDALIALSYSIDPEGGNDEDG
jgi:hypothetical protein